MEITAPLEEYSRAACGRDKAVWKCFVDYWVKGGKHCEAMGGGWTGRMAGEAKKGVEADRLRLVWH